jgi:hypothetical protein
MPRCKESLTCILISRTVVAYSTARARAGSYHAHVDHKLDYQRSGQASGYSAPMVGFVAQTGTGDGNDLLSFRIG